MYSIIDLWFKSLLLIFCATAIYFSGDIMIYISKNHANKEWINRIIAFIDILLIAIALVLILQIAFVILPTLLILITIIVVIDILIYASAFIVSKIKNMIRK